MICNCESIEGGVIVPCGRPASWRHPHYPAGAFCDYHKQLVELYRCSDWTSIEREVVGRNLDDALRG